MDWQMIRQQWDRYRHDAHRAWGRPSQEEVDATGGERQALIDLLQQHYQISPEQAATEVDDWTKTLTEIPAR